MVERPDRGALMARGLHYTAARAADRFLEIVADLQALPARADGPLAVGRRLVRPAMLQPLVNGVLRKAARHSRSKPFAMRNTAPLVSFTFDDVPASAYINGAAILEQHDMRGTFYIAAGICGTMDDALARDRPRSGPRAPRTRPRDRLPYFLACRCR